MSLLVRAKVSFFISLVIAIPAVAVEPQIPKTNVCQSALTSSADQVHFWRNLSESERRSIRQKHMFSLDTDPKRIERRPKYLTNGLDKDFIGEKDPAETNIEAADPSLISPVTYPNGVTKYRVSFTKSRYVEASTIADLFRGGPLTVRESRNFYPDGTEINTQSGVCPWVWDTTYHCNAYMEPIALGGVMPQPARGHLPNYHLHNHGRSRWWGKFRHVEIVPGEYEERIYWKGPIHQENRRGNISWLNHGYGSSVLTRFNPKSGLHEPDVDKEGYYTIFYERVKEEGLRASGEAMPWVTSLFARRLHPSMKKTTGKESEVVNLISPVSRSYYKALKRGEPDDEKEGFLAEGGNPFIEIQRNQIIKVWSANDFFREYGIFLDYAAPGADYKSRFTPVTDETGELVEFGKFLGLPRMMDGQKFGRGLLEYAPDGGLWLRFHFNLNENGVELKDRITAQVPVRIEYDESYQPLLRLDIDPEFSYMYETN